MEHVPSSAVVSVSGARSQAGATGYVLDSVPAAVSDRLSPTRTRIS